ncbi:MAG: hypothetical protein CW716_09565 [Candidatus Bathyarchaeum sp.]|nr:MAG: hypothetical protein CW716_09565 [Candidatus Bathyarchaeum sp.]
MNRSLRFMSVGFAVVVCGFLFVSLVCAVYEPSVGVKEGDWIEYDIDISGKGSPPPTHDVRWLKIEIVDVQGPTFSANFTVRYANGTMGSAIWNYNFTEGDVRGWTIIPSNLGPGDSFYDYSMHTGNPVNVTIESQEEKTVMGASRTVTYGSDNFRHKTWDKATGVFLHANERFKNVTNKDGWYIEDITVNTQAIATNMWNPQFLGLDTIVFYGVGGAIALVLLIWLVAVALSRTKMIKELKVSSSAKGKLAVITVIVAVLGEIAAMVFVPFYELGLSVSEFNMMLQTFWASFVLMSMWWRSKGNYFVHEITMLIVMCQSLVGFSAVLLMDPMSFSSMAVLANTTTRLVMNFLHVIFSVPALALGTWLVAIWRPDSSTYPAKSRRIAQLTAVLWMLSYAVGALDFLILHTTLFG